MMKRKMWSLFLTAALSLSLLTGCGSSGDATDDKPDGGDESSGYSSEIDMEEEPYTVAIQVVTLPGTEFEGKAEREAALNALTEPAINCKVEIQEVWISEIANTTSMAVAGDEKIDLVHVATVQPLSGMVGSDMLLDMNEDHLLENRGKKLTELFGGQMKAGEVDGRQLAVPASAYSAASNGIIYNKTIAQQCGVEIPERITMDELEEILYKIHEKNTEILPYYSGNGEMNYLSFLQGYESFGNESSYGIILDSGSDTTIENLYATDLFKDYCVRMNRWAKDGIQPGDPTDTNTAQDYYNAQKLFCVVAPINESQRGVWGASAEQNGFEAGFTELTDVKLTNKGITEYMWGIASNCERPDKAMDLLNFIYENADAANILKYGIEGTNYEYAEGSEKVIVLNGSYDPLFLSCGDETQMLIKSPNGEDYVEKMKAFNEEAVVSPISCYMFDDTDFQTESSTISSAIKEYLPRLQNGMCEDEAATLALIEEFNKKLDASGINDAIAANQEQLDAYLSAQE